MSNYDQTKGELCQKCGWAMKFPDEPCRCELERENAELRAEIKAHQEINRQLVHDKHRLDWLATSDHWFDTPANESFTPQSFRATIDAARKEAQP